MSDVFYIPGALKMAESKRSAVKGKALRTLDALISDAIAADRCVMAVYPDASCPVWIPAYAKAGAACAALLAYAGPIVPRAESV